MARTMMTAAALVAASVGIAPAFAQVSTKPRSKATAVKAADALPADSTGGTRTEGAVAFWLHLLHASDGESQIINAGPGALANFGGVARFKTLADNLRAFAPTYPADATPKGVILVSSGDNFLAGPEFNASLDKPTLPFYDSLALDLIGFDAATIGNHEFDFGPGVLEEFIAGFTGPVKFLTANLNFAGEPGLQAFVTSGRIAKSTILTVNGEQIGIVGATTESLPFISSPGNVVTNLVLPAVQAEVAALKGAGVNKIIVSSHLQGLTSETALAAQLTDVDVIIAGGGGELLANAGALFVGTDVSQGAYPQVVNGLDGKPVRVVATRGDFRYIGRLVVGFDAAGEIVVVDPISNPVRVSGVAPDAVAADPVVQAQVVDPVAAAVSALAANVIAVAQQPLDGRSTSIRAFETNLGNLCADAMLWNAAVSAQVNGTPAPDIALQNGGGMRNNAIIPAGNFTELNTFEVLPFANFISVVPNIPPAQLKEILENCVSNVSGTPGGGANNGRFAQIAGFRMTWDALGQRQTLDANNNVVTPGSRVREVVLNDGTVIIRNGQIAPGARPVNIATIDFLARGGDQFPFRGAPFVNIGVSYQLSLENYIRQYLTGVISAQDYPAGGEGRITRIN